MVIKKQILQKKVYQYTAVFEPAERGYGYTVTIPTLPGCISEGDSFEKALANIKEAAELYLEGDDRLEFTPVADGDGVVVTPIKITI